jgi:hypothetical protein
MAQGRENEWGPGQGVAAILMGAAIIGAGIGGIALMNSLWGWWFRGLVAAIFLGGAFVLLGLGVLVISPFRWLSQRRRDHRAT